MFWKSDEDYKEWLEEMVKFDEGHKKYVEDVIKIDEKTVNLYKRLVIDYPDVESMKPTFESCEKTLLMFREELAKIEKMQTVKIKKKKLTTKEKSNIAINKGFKVIQGGLCENA